MELKPVKLADAPHAGLVRPFETSETAQWRRRAEILTALNNIHNLADEARLRLDWRDKRSETPDEDLKVAEEALAELRKEMGILWPGESDDRKETL